MFHIYAMNVLAGPALYSGAKIVYLPKFEPKSFIKALEEHKVLFLIFLNTPCKFFLH